jgi:hypothetical protein
MRSSFLNENSSDDPPQDCLLPSGALLGTSPIYSLFKFQPPSQAVVAKSWTAVPDIWRTITHLSATRVNRCIPSVTAQSIQFVSGRRRSPCTSCLESRHHPHSQVAPIPMATVSRSHHLISLSSPALWVCSALPQVRENRASARLTLAAVAVCPKNSMVYPVPEKMSDMLRFLKARMKIFHRLHR